MAKILPSRPEQPVPPGAFAIVASQYNSEFVDGLTEAFRAEIEAIAPGSTVTVYPVPGSFEIPLMTQEIAARGGVDAIAAFGVILDGETAHATLIASSITQSLHQISLTHRVPVMHEVLLVKNEAQARARCLEPELNRGTEAARAAIRMRQALADFRR